MKRQIIKLDRPDCQIHVEVTGEGPAIIFAHGLGGNHMSWFQQVAHFSSRYTCVTFAHRGFAPSSPIAGGPDPSKYASDLAAIIGHLELSDYRIVAQSMGGWTAVEFALTKPDGLKAIVMACTTGTIDPLQIEAPERLRVPTWLQNEFSRSPALFARGIHPAAGERMAIEQPAKHLLYWQIDEQNAALDRAMLAGRLMTMRQRAPEALNQIECPILFVSGDEDVVIPPFAADAIVRAVPRASVVHIPSAGHSTYFERPVEFNSIVEKFLASHEP